MCWKVCLCEWVSYTSGGILLTCYAARVRAANTHTHAYVHTHTHTRIPAHTRTHMHTQNSHAPHAHTYTHAHANAHTHTHSHSHTYLHTHAYTHTRTHTHTHIPAHTRTLTRTHTHTCTHTHTHAHTHTHTPAVHVLQQLPPCAGLPRLHAPPLPLPLSQRQTLDRWGPAVVYQVGQNRIYTPYMTVYLVISLPKIPCIHRIYRVIANPTK